MQWFRMYNETALDPKLRLIAARAGVQHAYVIAIWTCMLCHASTNKGTARGTLQGWSDEEYAFHTGIDKTYVFAIRKEMEGRVLEGLHIIAWSDRQFLSDDAAARKRKQRAAASANRSGTETQAEENQGLNPDVTGHDRDRPVTVPTLSQSCPMPDTETETETEKERGEAVPPQRARACATRPLTRTRGGDTPPSAVLPEWLPEEAWAEWCTYRTQKCRKTWTQLAAEKCIQTLSKLRDDGHDPIEVIDQAIAAGWTGLFPVKNGKAQQSASKNAWMFNNDDPLFRRPV